MQVTIRDAEHINPERGYSFRIKTKFNFGVIFDIECLSMVPGLFDKLCNNFVSFIRGKLVKDVYFLGTDAFQRNFGPFKSHMDEEACQVLFDLLRQTLSGVYDGT